MDDGSGLATGRRAQRSAVLALALALAVVPLGGGMLRAGGPDEVAARCAAEWPDDYRMQVFCADRHADGALTVTQTLRIAEDVGDRQVARAIMRCAAEWTDGYGVDWRMAGYCVDRQIEAITRLRGGPMRPSQ